MKGRGTLDLVLQATEKHFKIHYQVGQTRDVFQENWLVGMIDNKVQKVGRSKEGAFSRLLPPFNFIGSLLRLISLVLNVLLKLRHCYYI